MATRRRPAVIDDQGERGMLRRVRAEDDHVMAVVELRTGEHVEIPFEHLEHHADGGYSIRGRWRDLTALYEGGLSIPVVAERVTTAVRPGPVQRVHVRRRVVSEAQVVETPVWHERIEVQHVPVDAYVDQLPAPRQEGDTLIIPCVEEVVVVEKRLHVREELRVRVVREQHVDRQNVVVRRHEVDVRRMEPELPNPKKH